MAERTILHVRLDADIKDDITARAGREQRDVSDMTRILLRFALDHLPEAVRDLPAEAG